jgi:TonB family protein
METIDQRSSFPPGDEHEINFLLVRDTSGDWPRWKRAALGSGIFHLVVITLLFVIKSGPYEPSRPENLRVPYVVKLYVPKELTQKAPNKGPVAKLLLSRPSAPSPKVNTPAPQLAKAESPKPPAPVPVPVPPAPPVPAPVPAPTPGETARTQPAASTPPPVAAPKPDAPKMIVEDSLQAHPPALRPGGILEPSNSIQDAMRSLGNSGSGSSSTRIGDSPEMSVGASLHLPAAAARLSNFQLKSDPMGVDFQPYLQQVLAAVKLNWSAVYPQSARLGLRGLVTLEFAILKNGTVQKIVFDGQSGAKALDQAAVAAISASDPLPSLPKDFRGDRIVLQMTSMYNMPR